MDYEDSVIKKNQNIYYPIIDVSLYNGDNKQKINPIKERNVSVESKMNHFDLCLQQSRLLSSKNHRKIFRSWLELEILFILHNRIGQDNKAKPVPEILNGEFSLRNECNERVCIHQCIDFLCTSSLIRLHSNATFVEDSQEVKEKIEYLHRIYPCSCRNKSNQSDFDSKDTISDSNQRKPSPESDWPVRTPEQAHDFIDELERLKNDRKNEVADTAEANLSGNSLLDTGKKG
jgi:hypothetical protein